MPTGIENKPLVAANHYFIPIREMEEKAKEEMMEEGEAPQSISHHYLTRLTKKGRTPPLQRGGHMSPAATEATRPVGREEGLA